MPNRFASGKIAIADCDRCGQRYKLKALKKEVVKTRISSLLVCPECWSPDHPQLQLGMYPVSDPQGLREPRPDRTYVEAGLNVSGNPTVGSRDIQWGWSPVGGSWGNVPLLTPNNLVSESQLGEVTITSV